ncbi:hypothetical protein [Streptomyces sp. NPDC058457]|uniref:hypothetical protein n=1 Tax=Streptomyces sp. NPDC058457 TaxID=3346507 RepID=UPI00364C1178
MKKVVMGAVAAGVFLAGAGTAVASSWQSLQETRANGAVLLQGRYQFNPPERNHGSFEWTGYLQDADANDRSNTFVRVRVEGHDWVRYYGEQRKTVYMHHFNWEGSQRYTDDAELGVCVDKGAFKVNSCSREHHYHIEH